MSSKLLLTKPAIFLAWIKLQHRVDSKLFDRDITVLIWKKANLAETD